jgi:hypothetical protein
MYILDYRILDTRGGRQEFTVPNDFICGFVGFVLKNILNLLRVHVQHVYSYMHKWFA